jgi:nitrite reductase/ring-hydroxylating ferredoxin subunit
MEDDRECPLRAACVEAAITRRSWLRSVGGVGAGMIFLGLGVANADALPIVFADGTQAGAERRYPIPAADSVTIDRSAQLIVVRAAGHLYVFALSCPHQNNAVKWVAKDNQFQCTKHDSHYQVDGLHVSGRATRNMDRYVIRRDGDSVVVDLHQWVQSDKDPAGWAAATITL